MIRFAHRALADSWQTQRRRILRETEEFLESALSQPEMGVRIPRVRVGHGSFPSSLSRTFWNKVLDLD